MRLGWTQELSTFKDDGEPHAGVARLAWRAYIAAFKKAAICKPPR